MLPENILLEIFDFYRLDAMMTSWECLWKWHRLAHVCRKWRHVISMSPRRLDLRILCENGAPIESVLRSWPTIPLIVKIGVTRLSELPRNIVVTLRHPERLCKIDFVTSSMTELIVEAMQNLKPCWALESIRITIKNATGPSILVHNAFLGGSAPRLREIKLDGIAFPFPAIQQVLLSTNNLVKLHLSKIPNDVYFSPEDLITGLSTSVQLERLIISFHSPDSCPPSSMTPSPSQCTSLRSLTFLDFYGTSKYLEEFVARIDTPALYKICIKLFNDIFFEIPQFCKFISRLNMPRSPTSATVTFCSKFVQVNFVHSNFNTEYYSLQNSCIPLDWQLSFVTQITSQLSPLLSSVHNLIILVDSSPKVSTGEEAVDSTQWLELFRPFTHVTKVIVWKKHLVPGILQALVMEDVATGVTVLLKLTTLCLYEYRSTPSVVKATKQLVATHRLSSHTVHLTDR